MTVNVFSVPIYFIVFRETLEAAVIVSVLLSFVTNAIADDNLALRKRLTKHIWTGALAGFVLCLCLGGAFIGVWYALARNIWGSAEDIWEGTFCLVASIIITVMGLAMLRLSALREKWRMKISQIMEKRQSRGIGNKSRKYAMFILPFITVLREGLEAVVFVGGVSLSEPASSFPLAVVMGLCSGILVGYFIYRGGSFLKIKYFVIASSCLLYLIAAGLFSRSVWDFEDYQWGKIIGGDADELGNGPGTYDITKSVWHVNCCNPEDNSNGGWGIFNAILGWQNSATIGSVVSYCMYWIFVTVSLIWMRVDEMRTARGKATLWRTIRRKKRPDYVAAGPSGDATYSADAAVEKGATVESVREIGRLSG